ncbi:MAG: inorganic pyrophosphatase [Rhodothermales bacterium]|jgi:inorganic pyrophosphatase
MAPNKLTLRSGSAATLTWGQTLDWSSWEALIRENGVTIDRPRGSVHPVHASIVYPMDYGYVNQTMSSDGEELDVFVGTSDLGLVGAIWTTDHRKGDRECKFLLDCSPQEIYMIHGFLNFDRRLMEGEMVLRRPMAEVWAGLPPTAEKASAAEPASTPKADYTPIDCGFYDRLEHWAVRGDECDILLSDGTSLRDRFVDFENTGDVEYAILASGERFRLDEIFQVNGVPRPGGAC